MRETIQNANGKQFHAVSLSGGKDSTAMLLLMIERDMPINMVLSADTGMEFPEMYEHLAKLDEHLFRERGIHITTLRHPKGFEYLMFDEPKQKPRSLENRAKLGIPPYGNGWPGIRVRWCTGQLKTNLITKEVNRLKGELGAIHYVGIAADEAWRCKDERYPLVEWGITEAQALQACYDRGFNFGGLYEIYHRASCFSIFSNNSLADSVPTSRRGRRLLVILGMYQFATFSLSNPVTAISFPTSSPIS